MIVAVSEEKSYLHENDGSNNESYNNYVLSDGIWSRLEAKTNAGIMDMLYKKARRKIIERGGMLSTEDAVKLVLSEDNRQELINDVADDLRKNGHPLLADAFRDEKTRPDAMRVLKSMLDEMESPD